VRTRRVPRYIVSILVFVDVALEQFRQIETPVYDFRVSILVFVDVALEPKTGSISPARPNVSILVFVDVALEP